MSFFIYVISHHVSIPYFLSFSTSSAALRYLSSFHLFSLLFFALLSELPSFTIEVGHVSILYSIKLASIPVSNNEKRPRPPPLSPSLFWALLYPDASSQVCSAKISTSSWMVVEKHIVEKLSTRILTPYRLLFSLLHLRSLFDLFLALRYPRKQDVSS